MTERDHLRDLKRVAKDMARSRQLPLNEAQNEVAISLGFPHWAGLMSKLKSGHSLTDQDVATAQDAALGGEYYPHEGTIDGHPYHLCESLRDVIMHGKGWRIVIFEAPSAPPLVSVTDKRFARNPINDPNFVEAALRVAQWKATQVRANIARDWSRRSTKPDAQGVVTHPLSGEGGDTWFCLHCDAKISGRDIARNLWHCPSCSATPIDIFSDPFWLSPDQELPG